MLKVRSFVTAMGRSGTMWLAHALDSDPSLNVYHEPIRTDAGFVDHRNSVDHMGYLKERREQMRAMATSDWCEVNSYLRYLVPELKQMFSVPVIGLVRDGKLTVRSIMGHSIFRQQYKGIDRFAAVCHYWVDAYETLIRECETMFALEELNEDYGNFKMLCDLAGVNVTKHQWEKHANIRKNVSIPADRPLKWTEEEYKVFDEICGETHRGFGYN